jgi:hypothetical protein
MKKFFKAIGHFFKTKWAFVVTAVLALVIGTAGGYFVGHHSSDKQNERTQFAQKGQFTRNRQFSGRQNDSSNDNSNKNSNSDDNSDSDTQGGASQSKD